MPDATGGNWSTSPTSRRLALGDSYVLGHAQKAVDGHIPTLDECDPHDDVEIMERLTSHKGIGAGQPKWLLIFNLGRADFWPVDRLGCQEEDFQFAYGKRKLPSRSTLHDTASGGHRTRTAAAWYLWRAADFLDGEGW